MTESEGHCHDEAIRESTNGDAALASGVEQLGCRPEIVARRDKFEVDGLEETSKHADLCRSRAPINNSALRKLAVVPMTKAEAMAMRGFWKAGRTTIR